MSGINFGYSYTCSRNNRNQVLDEEGVFFGVKSKKYMVIIKNDTQSKCRRPFVNAAQFDTKKEADTFYLNHRINNAKKIN